MRRRSIRRRINNFVTVEGGSRNIQDKMHVKKRRNEIRCSKKERIEVVRL